LRRSFKGLLFRIEETPCRTGRPSRTSSTRSSSRRTTSSPDLRGELLHAALDVLVELLRHHDMNRMSFCSRLSLGSRRKAKSFDEDVA